MGANLTDLDKYFDPGLTLTILGREYTIPLASARLGLWCRRMAEAAGGLSDAADETQVQESMQRLKDLPEHQPGDATFPELMLGGACQQMVQDEIPDPYIGFAAQTAFVWIVSGEEAAARFWQSGGRPEAPRPDNRAQRRMTSTDAAARTRTPGSASGTSTRRSPGGAGARSRGRRS
jgi:hypothetical protein